MQIHVINNANGARDMITYNDRFNRYILANKTPTCLLQTDRNRRSKIQEIRFTDLLKVSVSFVSYLSEFPKHHIPIIYIYIYIYIRGTDIY